jgi:hypothetical protein
MTLYRLRENLAYSRIARALLTPLTAKGCRRHWLQQAIADGNIRQALRYSIARGLVNWIYIHK